MDANGSPLRIMVDSMRVTQKLHDERGTVGASRRAAEKFRQSRGAIISQDTQERRDGNSRCGSPSSRKVPPEQRRDSKIIVPPEQRKFW